MNCWDILKRHLATLCVILATLTCFSSIRAQARDFTLDLDFLLQQKHYAELEEALARRAFGLPPSSLAYFQGVMANRTNHVRHSVRLLEPLLTTLIATNPVRAELALCTLADDYAKSFRYANAATLYAQANLVAEQQQKASECGAGREASRWSLLSDALAQTVTSRGAFTVRGKRSALGLFQVPISSGTYTGTWIVDSGANLSVVSRSVANKLGIETSTDSETAQGAGGLAVSVRTAVIPEIHLGQALVRNVAVLVVEDSALSFPRFNYRIEGCLGLPVMAALGRVTFYHDGRISFSPADTAPRKRSSLHHNLFLEEFTPVIVADFGHRKQLFTLDTGAMGTILSAEFYEENIEIVDATPLVRLELSGAGGTLTVPAYKVLALVVKFGTSCARVKDLVILTAATGANGRLDEFYGEIGESTLNSFASFTLDFRAMHFSVTGGDPRDCLEGGTLASSEIRGRQIDPGHVTEH
jgi:predicted aspartyl protease